MTIQVTQGERLQVTCVDAPNPNWKMGANNITAVIKPNASASANVYQYRSGFAILFIKSVNPGTYTCHFGGIQESVIFSESMICYYCENTLA